MFIAEEVYYLKNVFFFLLFSFFLGCSSQGPSEENFSQWLGEVYQEETGLVADSIVIFTWEKTSQDIIKLAPEVSGLRVEAAIFTIPADKEMGAEFENVITHYVFCRYFQVSDEWYLHAASWGGGFWIEEPDEWEHLVKRCQSRVEELNKVGVNRLVEE